MLARLPAHFVIPFVLLAATAGASSAAGSEAGLWAAGSTTLRSVGGDFFVATARGERRVALPASLRVEELFPLRRGAFLSALAPAPRSAAPSSPRQDLYLALLDDQGIHPLPAPAAATAEAESVRENAVPLVSAAGELAGLAWLEGADRQSHTVRYASWDGMSWSEPATVAAAAPGSQLALAAATLGDGSRLLVWSRFDGHDDEIVAARFADGRWSPAQPLAPDNAVPDVTPAVIAVPGGALATWSRYDGHDYRVVISRFDGREWSPALWAGPAGSTLPFLTLAATGSDAAGKAPAWLTFYNARPRGWGVLELDSAGRVLSQGSVVDTPSARPALAALPSGEVRLRWATVETDVELK